MVKSANFDELMIFLDYLADKGLMKSSTAKSRKATVNKVFGALSSQDRENVLSVDIDEIMERFMNLEGGNYTPSSLQVYKSRVRSVLDDFSSYRKDPMGFKPSTQKRSSQKSEEKTSVQKTKSPIQSKSENARQAPDIFVEHELASTILPIPIRADLVVKIQGIPFDLTKNEAAKISAVVTAMVISD